MSILASYFLRPKLALVAALASSLTAFGTIASQAPAAWHGVISEQRVRINASDGSRSEEHGLYRSDAAGSVTASGGGDFSVNISSACGSLHLHRVLVLPTGATDAQGSPYPSPVVTIQNGPEYGAYVLPLGGSLVSGNSVADEDFCFSKKETIHSEGVEGLAACTIHIPGNLTGAVEIHGQWSCDEGPEVTGTTAISLTTLADRDSDGFPDSSDGCPDDYAPPNATNGCPPGKVPIESKRTACSDGRDNDQDARIDFPADPGCKDAQDDSEIDQNCAKPVMNVTFAVYRSMDKPVTNGCWTFDRPKAGGGSYGGRWKGDRWTQCGNVARPAKPARPSAPGFWDSR